MAKISIEFTCPKEKVKSVQLSICEAIDKARRTIKPNPRNKIITITLEEK